MKLTKSEWEIMEVLWDAQKPLSRTGILEHSKDRSWKESSIHILLNSMLKKGAIEVAGFEKMGSHYGRTYVAVLDVPEFVAYQVQTMVEGRGNWEDTVKATFNALLKKGGLSAETIGEIEQMLKEAKKQ